MSKLRFRVSCLGGLLLVTACHSSSLLVPRPPTVTAPPPPPVSGSPTVLEPAVRPGPPVLPQAEPPTVVSYGPQGAVDVTVEPQVRFDQPMVAVGQPMLDEPGLRIVLSPKTAGRTRWRTPELLVFEPEKLAPAQRYQATVEVLPSAAPALARLLAERPLRWTFTTPGPTVEASYPLTGDELPDWHSQHPVLIKLSQPVDLVKLRRAITVRTVEDPPRTLAVTVAKADVKALTREWWAGQVLVYGEPMQDRVFVVRPTVGWPSDRTLALELAAGLVGRLGPTASAAPWRLTWKTPAPPRVAGVDVEERSCGGSGFTVRLDSEVTKAQLAAIHVMPRPPQLTITLADDYAEQGGREITLAGAFVPTQSYTVRIDPRLRNTNGYRLGEGTGGKPWTRVVSLAARPSLRLSPQGIFPAAAPPVFGVTTRWVQSLRMSAAVLDADQADRALHPGKDAEVPATFAELGVSAERVHVREVPLDPKAPTFYSDAAMDLRDLVGDVRGVFLVEVAVTGLVPPPAGEPAFTQPAPVRRVFRRTDLGPVAFHSQARTVVKVARLGDGGPARGVEVARVDGGKTVPLGHTDELGLLVVPWSASAPAPAELVLRVTDAAASDEAVVHASLPTSWGWPKTAERGPGERPLLGPAERALLALTLDRDAFRPGEAIALTGFAIVETPFSPSTLRSLPAGTPVRVWVEDAADKVVAEQTLALDASGKFWGKLVLAKGARLGSLQVRASCQGGSTTYFARLEDFRAPDFVLTATPARNAILLGEPLRLTADARLYAGGQLRLAELGYSVDCYERPLALPGLPYEWSVGDTTGYTGVSDHGDVLAAKGALGHVEFPLELPATEWSGGACRIELQATDASRQVVGARTQVQVHPASFYLAVRPPRSSYAGDPAKIGLRSLTWTGERRDASAVSVRVVHHKEVHVERVVDGRVRTRTETHDELVKTCQLELSAKQDSECATGALGEGDYRVEVSAPDGKRRARTVTRFWVSSKAIKPMPRPARAFPEHLTLQIAKTSSDDTDTDDPVIAPGQRLAVTVRSPCAAGSGLALLERAGIRRQTPFVLADHGAKLDLTVEDAWIPSVHLAALVVCQAEAGYPKVEHAELELRVPAKPRELEVSVEVPPTSAPGRTLPVTVVAHSHDAKAVAGGQVALWVVDEAVLSLTDYRARNPMPALLPHRRAETTQAHDFGALLHTYVATSLDPLLHPLACLGLGSFGTLGKGGGSGSGAGYGRAAPVPRAHFETTPIFIGNAVLDSDGRARLEGRLPDNLTTFRVTALVSAPIADGSVTGRFGLGQSKTVVTAPFFIRPALPRQLRPGDQAELAAIVRNQTGSSGQVTVQARVSKGSGLTFVTAPHTAALANGGEQRFGFVARAEAAGTVEVELVARMTDASGHAFADSIRLPISIAVEPTLVERSAYYGTLDDERPAALATRLPATVDPAVGGLSLDLSSSLIGELRDAFQFLLDYPYGCIEQTSSRVLSLVTARQLGQRFGLDDREAARRLAAGIERIASMQTESGGFGYWPNDPIVHPYATGFATWVLWQAQQSGTPAPAGMLGRALDYLAGWAEQGGVLRAGQGYFGDSAALLPSERAMALFVLAQAGRALPAKAVEELFAERDTLPVFGRALLLAALARTDATDARVATLGDEIVATIGELPGSAHVRERESPRWDYLFHSQSRSDAMALFALLAARPEHPLVAKLARGLLDARGSGRWRNTQENAYALVALLAYARRFEGAAPQLGATAWVGQRPILQATVSDAAPAAHAFVPMAQVATQSPSVVLQRQGQGRLYFRLGTEWTDLAGALPPRDQGLAISRAVRTHDGSTRIEAGQAAAFDITLKSHVPLGYVAVEVPVPGGLEPVLEHLGKGHAVSRLGPHLRATSYEERLPDRVRLFYDRLGAGEHHVTIELRATTPGEYLLPPARAEAMYMPEVYGRSEAGRLTVVEP